MGKYMKKSKITGDISVMEVSKATAPSPGVRTRAAKTLALKRLNSSAADSALPNDSSCYLQLRSRRLEKPSSLIEPKQPPRVHRSGIKESGSRSRVDSVNSVPVAQSSNEDECFDNFVSVQVSCGENSLGFESRHSTRESTPCNFVEDMEIMVTPGSSTRSMCRATKEYTREQDNVIPTTSEMEEFFAYAEQQQQRLFMEKYNFDIVNDIPLSGRYEWVQVKP
ncbi:Cyclin-dependent kinase inhibitor 3 [Arabidopsis thaliana]|jgi:hypothetical protein|uniref:Cyclin-dependent kinase inhibitor 3 n=4 Tax=Arabidopsis TaxID=3701 RepID=KRP3_ARATH|nr:inhibitor/interactor with cyclin-dependent kinase [Arabidopsis thaliana]Q9FKB5.1 RecName: Full=Cyclin-dependent kinase inhibitor 3; AltName: Full=Inhibitor/interactor of CDK protein 6; AltName: Full=KIP-related protein 3 [Arabidopsis thaliana]KAG7605410.1 Cyclin-dependent kinase inhibitor [Arabidopsis thaliana x Arabidopsis arenosa]KAG7612329.1 Cyclin-dependent kinase inhibitor [Arabidopsis suecica]ABF19043.1 At5g48820 [Arabidopsis thaliana]AED95728.1 inhibitor/interactor with cyclin-depend|eukprot:NP_199693.1 inhibitor/interactor with cyclin-dependent kinase [Arabidopsis thaliana]